MRQFSTYILEATAPINIGAVRSMFEKSLAKFATKEGTPGEIAAAIRRGGSKYLYGVSIRKVSQLESGDISLWGFYDGSIDQHYETEGGTDMPIELVILFSTKDKKIALTKDGVKEFARYLSETLAHEWIHLKQERSRNWKTVKPKSKYLHKVDNIEVGSYLANDDEIEAHALNIAGSILDAYETKKKAFAFLKSPKPGAISDHHLDMYIAVFGKDHAVTKRLFKKVVYYINKRT